MWGSKTVIEKQYTVVEIEKQHPQSDNVETIAAVQSLENHAGFRWLLTKLKLQGARLSSELLTKRHSDIREVEFLQSGLQWCNWLQSQLDLSRERYRSMRSATTTEQAHFHDIESAIELIAAQPQVEQS